jgi:hypothetical protein
MYRPLRKEGLTIPIMREEHPEGRPLAEAESNAGCATAPGGNYGGLQREKKKGRSHRTSTTR